MKWTRKRLYLIGAFLLAGLGFSSCSKPEDDPFNDDWYYTVPGVYAYGTPMTAYGTIPAHFQDKSPEEPEPVSNNPLRDL